MKLKLIIPILILAFPAYTVARHFVLKHYQWQAFYKLEEEVLAEVTSEDFLERTFGVGPEYEPDSIFLLEGYGPNAPLVYARIDTLLNFLEGIKPNSRKEFDVVIFLGREHSVNSEPNGRFYTYPVSVCGDNFCEFDESKLRLAQGSGQKPSWNIEVDQRRAVEDRDGFDFEVAFSLYRTHDKKLRRLVAAISIEAVSWVDEVAGQFFQRRAPEYWNQFGVFAQDYVVDLVAFRGENTGE